MGLFLKQDQGRSELQSKVIADLQQRMHETSKIEGARPEPGADFTKDQHQTNSSGLAITLLVLALIIAIVFVVVKNS